MEAFGVRFAVTDATRLQSLRLLFAEIKHDKDAGAFRPTKEWERLVPDKIKSHFSWPTAKQREHWAAVRTSTIIAIPQPSEQLGVRWSFDRVFEAIEESEYDLLRCDIVESGVAEMQINPHAYPYGGVGPLVVLAEAFGFKVLGVNECGMYENREQLMDRRRGH